MDKLKTAGCPVQFRPMEETVSDYMTSYLQKADPYL
jgi:hypothetical protein